MLVGRTAKMVTRGHPVRALAVAAALAMGLVAGFANTAEAKCTRLALSAIAFGKANTSAKAHEGLDRYIARWTKARGIGSVRKSRRTTSCRVWLVLPPFGTEYRCRAEATICW